ncbi:MAG: metalloregulator ArsR/SmtB family transcription factor [Chloroflexota bacterium]
MKLFESGKAIAAILKTISPPARLAILLAIGEGEACVCHLEAVLGRRQAYISQHLMALRQAEILLDRRDGRFVYYRIADPALLALVRDAGCLAGVETASPPSAAVCECPHCAEVKPGYLLAPRASLDADTPTFQGS